jgi:thermolysin
VQWFGHPAALAGAGLIVAVSAAPSAQQAAMPERVLATLGPARTGQASADQQNLAAWDRTVTEWASSGRLVVVQRQADPDVPGRTLERYDQFHRGVPVFGGALTRQLGVDGTAISVIGTVHPDVDLEVAPALGALAARQALVAAGSGPIVEEDGVRLMVLPTPSGHRLTWTARVTSAADGHVRRLFIDAGDGAPVFQYDDTWTQVTTVAGAETGAGTGIVGDRLKLGVQKAIGGYRAVDLLWPGSMTTHDMKGDPDRTRAVQTGAVPAAPGDIAQDADNVWTDRAVSSAHAYARLSLFYLRQTHRHSGLDGRQAQPALFVNLARPENFGAQNTQFPLYFNNAFYTNRRAFFGVGDGGSIRNFAAGLDVVAHELAHGVTAFTSNLIYLNESGALNEAFSDIIGAATEFAYQAPGSVPGSSDWLLGEDVRMSGAFRSMENPTAFGHPDHYALRFMGTADNGGVHINSGIMNHVFYLAVAGGTHRLSGLFVPGVGIGNRQEIERVVFRAFTSLLTADATFATARVATIQAARDLYGPGSRAEIAMIEAWDAVGVD